MGEVLIKKCREEDFMKMTEEYLKENKRIKENEKNVTKSLEENI